MGFRASASSRRGALLGVLAAVLLALGVRWALLPRPDAPDVVLITVDTLRADRLGCYGATTRTPVIDRLAAEGMLFEHAASPIPETRPAHYTLFTSRYPRDHGVLSNSSASSGDLLALPEIYAEAGYLSAGFAGCALFDAAAGSELGFGFFDAPQAPQRPAEEMVTKAIEWLRAVAPERRFFLWLHLFDPHMPYEPPPPFNGGSPEMLESWPDFSWHKLLAFADRHDGDLPRAVFDRARALYDGEVEYVDYWLGRFFQALDELGRWDRTVVVLAADHGECFSKGVFFDHSHCLNDGAIRVPLIVRYPPRIAAGQRIAAQVELLDVAPALLRLSDLPVPEEFSGRGLLARAEDPAASEPYAFFEHPYYRSVDIDGRQKRVEQLRSVAGEPTRPIAGDQLQVGAMSGVWRYLRHGAQERLYNLADDPGELNDLSAEDRVRRDRFRLAVRKWMREHPPRVDEETTVHPELMESLKALGYL